jgi:hypothetical protein
LPFSVGAWEMLVNERPILGCEVYNNQRR